MASNKSGEMLKQAGHIWKMLDSLADSDPEAYRRFVQKNMMDGKKELSPPEPFMCIKTRMLQDTDEDIPLYVNVCQWGRVPAPKTPSDAIPITGGPLDEGSLETGHCKVTRVAINPDVLRECSAQKTELDLLIRLISDFLSNQHSIRISKIYTIADEMFIGNPSELKDFFNQKRKFEEQVMSATDDLRALTPEALLARLGQMSVDDQDGEDSKIPLGSDREGKEERTDRVLIEEIGNTESSFSQPRYEMSIREKDNKKGRRVVLRVELPGVNNVSECDLQINKGEVSLHAADKYQLDLKISEPFVEEAVSAKFIKKYSILSVTLPIEQD